ncbi:hypothetical protein T12_15709 [Trichinella patagoniensis]|uniref:Uncharacterized protein n=1 Tax=Trichinella patagoniensis TaxID=990121 RepID=A0A0V1A5H1_9BILA|nr:hypothetical protein T12_15709 [Trichinella patagoniensis]
MLTNYNLICCKEVIIIFLTKRVLMFQNKEETPFPYNDYYHVFFKIKIGLINNHEGSYFYRFELA